MRDAWLDLVHGARCLGCAAPGRALCARCAATLPGAAGEVRPTPCPAGLVACWAAGEYAGLLRALVVAHKEQGCLGLAGPLGSLLATAVGEALCQAVPGNRGPDARLVVLVPVPSRPAVVRSRGHDATGRMVRVAATRMRRRGEQVVVARLLRAGVPVADQAGLGAAERSANLRETMRVRPHARAALVRSGRPVQVVVCDDVLTTGATAREAQRALEVSGIPVAAVATVAATRKRWPPGRARGPAR